jgi:uncharacterized protein
MNLIYRKLEESPLLARVLPFVIFVVLTFFQGWFGEGSRYWIYLLKTLVGAGLIVLVWPLVREMRWVFTWEALVVGVAVFAIWVGLDGLYPRPELGPPWNPYEAFAGSAGLAAFFISVRIVGSTLVVPPIEEIFYRSFLYRYIARPDFQSLPLNYFAWVPFLVAALIFGAAHAQHWLVAIPCAMAYQGLVIYKNRLGDAITAHAITNFLLGTWVVSRGEWHFW